MSYEFKRLSEVEALTEVPEGAKVLAEANGQIVRVPGSGLGGSGGGIKTAIIKASDYDQAIQYAKGELPSPPSGDATYECINMTFEEAYDAMAKGEPMTALMMAVKNNHIFNGHCVIFFMGTLINNVPCIGIEEPAGKMLFWTSAGISTTEPVA